MDFIKILEMLLPLIIQLLPLIVNKPDAVAKQALLRRVVRFQALAETAKDPGERFAYEEAAELFACLVEADRAGRQEIVAGIQQAARGVL